MTPGSGACDHYATGAGYCGKTPTRRYLNGTRCPEHTPARVAGRADTVPPRIGTLAWFLDRAKRRTIGTPQSASTLLDDRAIALGRARAVRAEAEARMRENERRGTRPQPAPATAAAGVEQPELWGAS